jgi:hypothetical protein
MNTNKHKILTFLCTQSSTPEIEQLIQVAHGLESSVPVYELIEYVDGKKKEAEVIAKAREAEVRHLQLFLDWQRVLDMLIDYFEPTKEPF